MVIFQNVKKLLERILLITIFVSIVMGFFLIREYLLESQSFSKKAEKIVVEDGGKIKRALFSPDDHIQEVLLGLIEKEKESISVATFTFTDPAIAKALIEAKKRGVKVEMLADGKQSIQEYSKIHELCKAKIPIWIYPNQRSTKKLGIMHNKFMIFQNSLLNRPIVSTGSYNFTKSANRINQENIIILDDSKIVECYKNHFQIVKKRCNKLKSNFLYQ